MLELERIKATVRYRGTLRHERHVGSMIISTLFKLLLAALLACMYVVINFWLAKKLIDQSVLIKKWAQNILQYFRGH